MRSIAPARRIAVLLLLGGGSAFAQSTLPALSPTALPATSPNGVPATSPSAAPRPGRAAQVTFVEGQIEVTADNSSLNQILRDIARLTGMTITGGVIDEHVYGKYGPAAPAEILTNLLAGTGSNMLLRETASHAPEELVLTPRQGGVTPPNPNAAGFEDDSSSNEQAVRSRLNPIPPPSSPQMQGVPPPAFVGLPTVNSTPGTVSPADTNPPPPGTVTSQSPNGVQTPQQIYEQLQRLQQAQPHQ